MKAKAEGFAAMPCFIPNEVRESMGWDKSDDPNANKLYVKTGYVLLEDLNIKVDDIDNAAGDYNNVVQMAANKIAKNG